MANNKTHESRISANETRLIKLNAKMNAIIWMFGLIIALGIANIVMGLR